MKKILLLALVALSVNIYGQGLQLASIKLDGQGKSNIPRISWSLPFDYPIAKLSDKSAMFGGVVLKNTGFITKIDSNKYKFRSISLGPNLGVATVLGENIILTLQVGMDYSLHYKDKKFVNGERSKKEIMHKEWGSQRINQVNYYAGVGVGVNPGVYLYAQYYFLPFFNKDFTETINNVTVKTYEKLEVSRFDIGISFLVQKSE